MTVPTSWREAYRKQVPLARLLKAEVDQHFEKARPGWFTHSRVKEEESFHQKIETGRIEEIEELEDFFGALLVVPLPSDIASALEFLDEFFVTKYRRPPDSDHAQYPASAFRFNDIRLYGHLRPDESMPPTPVDNMIFEVQVRTFFQHAWSSATHDLVYKHPRFSWARSRVAAQIKAILESAEMTIDSIDALENSPVLPREGSPESELNLVLEVVTGHWNPDDLPENLKRLTETLSDLCLALSLDSRALDQILTRGRAELGGHPDGWSPYQCTVDYYSRYEADKLRRVLKKKSHRPKRIFVTDEVLDRLGLRLEECQSAAT
ncbi:hypothetical protein [Herbiconiux sp.]|uniref:hypothetical protein n=1 Tax=Herbiconiux sp. TaxID=1871186 RepID=UPI0025C17335|nr:hypothetical protein [Herbiconiux sp.]